MKFKLFLIIFVTGLAFYSCKKPRLGVYRLYIDEVETSRASLEQSSSKHLTFAIGDFDGTLNKNINKVTGVLNVLTNSKATYTISVEGRIQPDGLPDYKIEGIYRSGYTAGLFRISKVRN